MSFRPTYHPWTRLLRGCIAGGAGTIALQLATYGDMLLRGRSASNVPAETARRLARLGGAPSAVSGSGEAAQNRQSALGALLGYATGLGFGSAYALARPRLGRRVPLPVAALTLGITAMAATDLPASAVGAAQPSRRSFASWAADVVPHLVYGTVTAVVYEWLVPER